MRRLCLMIAVAGVACAALAEPQMRYFPEVATGTNTSGTATLDLSGYVEAVYVSVSDGVSTGTVAVSYAPVLGSTAINIATNAVVDEDVFRPAVDATDISGAALTSDPPRRYALVGETVTFSVTGSPTGVTWKCMAVIEDAR